MTKKGENVELDRQKTTCSNFKMTCDDVAREIIHGGAAKFLEEPVWKDSFVRTCEEKKLLVTKLVLTLLILILFLKLIKLGET